MTFKSIFISIILLLLLLLFIIYYYYLYYLFIYLYLFFLLFLFVFFLFFLVFFFRYILWHLVTIHPLTDYHETGMISVTMMLSISDRSFGLLIHVARYGAISYLGQMITWGTPIGVPSKVQRFLLSQRIVTSFHLSEMK